MQKTRIAGALAAVAVLGAAGAAIAGASGTGGAAGGSRMDDGKALLPKAAISESAAIAAAQSRADGALNEVDLEYRDGRLVFNVDVGAHDVKVDAASGAITAVDAEE